jgi:lipopolysaccharide transport system permease protein
MSVAELEPRSIPHEASSPTGDPAAPVTIIEPRPGWQAVNCAELWKYRELIYFLTWRDIKVRYKQTVMGAAWAVIQPLLTSLMFVVLFGIMAKMNEDTVHPYLVIVFAGQMAWQFFQSAVTQSGQSLVSSANLISKVYFPRLIVPIAAVGAGLVDFAMSVGVMAIMLTAYGIVPPLQVLLLPFLFLGVLTVAIGFGALLSALTVAYRDFRYVIPFMMQMWMLATPVGMPLTKYLDFFDYVGVNQSGVTLYFFLNPMAGFVQGFRWCLLDEPLNPIWLVSSVCSSVLFLVVGAVYFRKVERRFADIV